MRCLTCSKEAESLTIVGGGPGRICTSCACSILRAFGCHERANELDGGNTIRPGGAPDASDPEDTEVVTVDYLEWMLVNQMWAMHAAEDEDLAKVYRQRAGALWSSGDEKAAKILRDVLVPELEERAKQYRKRRNENPKPPERPGEREE